MQKDSFTLKQINFPEKDNLVKHIDLINSVFYCAVVFLPHELVFVNIVK